MKSTSISAAIAATKTMQEASGVNAALRSIQEASGVNAALRSMQEASGVNAAFRSIQEASGVNSALRSIQEASGVNAALRSMQEASGVNAAFRSMQEASGVNAALRSIQEASGVNAALRSMQEASGVNAAFRSIQEASGVNVAFRAMQEASGVNAAFRAMQEASGVNAAFRAMQESSGIAAARAMALSIFSEESQASQMIRTLARSFSSQDSATIKFVKNAARSLEQNDYLLIKAFANDQRTWQDSITDAENEKGAGLTCKDSNDSVLIELDTTPMEKVFEEFGKVSEPSDEFSFMDWYDSLSPSKQLLLVLFLTYWLNIFSNLSMPLYDNWAYIFKNENTRTATKLVIHSAELNYEKGELSDYRFVSTSVLNVRAGPTINSEVIDELKSGHVVKLLVKNKRWIQVEFVCQETGERKIGWVFSRYLSKFK